MIKRVFFCASPNKRFGSSPTNSLSRARHKLNPAMLVKSLVVKYRGVMTNSFTFAAYTII